MSQYIYLGIIVNMCSKLFRKASSWQSSILNYVHSSGQGGFSSFEYSCNPSIRSNFLSASQAPSIFSTGNDSHSRAYLSTNTRGFAQSCQHNLLKMKVNVQPDFVSAPNSLLGKTCFNKPVRGVQTSCQKQQGHSKVTDSESKPQSPNILSAMLQENPKEMFEKTDSENKENHEKESNKEKDDNSDSTESAFLRSQRYAKWMLLATFGITVPLGILEYGKPKETEDGEILRDQYSAMIAPAAYIARAWGEVMDVKREIVEPISTKLLPDPLKEPYYQPPYTLVIELMDVFLRPVYDSVTGWRFKKRPGIEYFLSQLTHPLYEIVIFTRETGPTAWPLIDSMDSKGYIMYRLFRDSARYKSGFSFGNILDGELPHVAPYYQKDLSFLNRDLSKVIIVDCDKKAYENNPDNGLYIEKWDGSSSDSALYDLATLLRTIATSNVEDVRPILRHYAKHDDPLQAFKEAQLKAQEDIKLMKDTKPKVQFSSTLSSFFGKR